MIYALTDPRCGHTFAVSTFRRLVEAHRDLLWCAGRTDIDITTHPDDTDPDDLHPAHAGCTACAGRDEASIAAVYRRDLIRVAETSRVDAGALVDFFTSLTATTCDGPVFTAHAAHHAAQAALEQGLIPAAAPVVLEPAMFSEA